MAAGVAIVNGCQSSDFSYVRISPKLTCVLMWQTVKNEHSRRQLCRYWLSTLCNNYVVSL